MALHCPVARSRRGGFELGVHRQEVIRPVPTEHRLDCARHLRIAEGCVIEFALCAARHPDHCRQVRSRRLAPRGEPVRIELVRRGIGPKETDRGLHVLHCGRVHRLAREPVIEAGNGVALRRVRGNRRLLHGLVTSLERTTVDLDDERERTFAGGRKEQIQLLRTRLRRVRNVREVRRRNGTLGNLRRHRPRRRTPRRRTGIGTATRGRRRRNPRPRCQGEPGDTDCKASHQ